MQRQHAFGPGVSLINALKIGIIVPENRNDKVIPRIKPERYNIIEVNDNAD